MDWANLGTNQIGPKKPSRQLPLENLVATTLSSLAIRFPFSRRSRRLADAGRNMNLIYRWIFFNKLISLAY
jgi:hypothetical protein